MDENICGEVLTSGLIESVTISLERYDKMVKELNELRSQKECIYLDNSMDVERFNKIQKGMRIREMLEREKKLKEEHREYEGICWKELPIGTKVKCEDADGVEKVYYFWEDCGADLIKIFKDEGQYWYKKNARLYV